METTKYYTEVAPTAPITHDDMVHWLEAMKASGVGMCSQYNRRMCDAIVAAIKQNDKIVSKTEPTKKRVKRDEDKQC